MDCRWYVCKIIFKWAPQDLKIIIILHRIIGIPSIRLTFVIYDSSLSWRFAPLKGGITDRYITAVTPIILDSQKRSPRLGLQALDSNMVELYIGLSGSDRSSDALLSKYELVSVIFQKVDIFEGYVLEFYAQMVLVRVWIIVWDVEQDARLDLVLVIDCGGFF